MMRTVLKLSFALAFVALLATGASAGGIRNAAQKGLGNNYNFYQNWPSRGYYYTDYDYYYDSSADVAQTQGDAPTLANKKEASSDKSNIAGKKSIKTPSVAQGTKIEAQRRSFSADPTPTVETSTAETAPRQVYYYNNYSRGARRGLFRNR